MGSNLQNQVRPIALSSGHAARAGGLSFSPHCDDDAQDARRVLGVRDGDVADALPAHLPDTRQRSLATSARSSA